MAPVPARDLPKPGMDVLDFVQWPAMAVTVLAAWLVASSRKQRRFIGFWVFLLSNALWVAWGLHTDAYALVFLQLCLAAMNIRGAMKAEPAGGPGAQRPEASAADGAGA